MQAGLLEKSFYLILRKFVVIGHDLQVDQVLIHGLDQGRIRRHVGRIDKTPGGGVGIISEGESCGAFENDFIAGITRLDEKRITKGRSGKIKLLIILLELLF